MNRSNDAFAAQTIDASDALSSRAAALTRFRGALAGWDFPGDACIQISVVSSRRIEEEGGRQVMHQQSHADLFIAAADRKFIEAALVALADKFSGRLRRAAIIARKDAEKISRTTGASS